MIVTFFNDKCELVTQPLKLNLLKLFESPKRLRTTGDVKIIYKLLNQTVYIGTLMSECSRIYTCHGRAKKTEGSKTRRRTLKVTPLRNLAPK